MIAQSTAHALNKRVLNVLYWFEHWQKWLLDEARKQNVVLYEALDEAVNLGDRVEVLVGGLGGGIDERVGGGREVAASLAGPDEAEALGLALDAGPEGLGGPAQGALGNRPDAATRATRRSGPQQIGSRLVPRAQVFPENHDELCHNCVLACTSQ